MTTKSASYQRVLLKLGGEALAGDRGYGIDDVVLARIAGEIQEIHALGCEIALVLGGGNILRGVDASARGIARATGDYMGMLATVINSLAMQEALEKLEVPTRVMSALTVSQVAEPYIRRRATRHLEKGRVVIFASGTGNPYFTTDTAASLRAMEIGAQAIFKATKVDGIYSADPMEDSAAERYQNLTYLEVLQQNLKVMDSTAISLCMDNHLPIIVFSMLEPGISSAWSVESLLERWSMEGSYERRSVGTDEAGNGADPWVAPCRVFESAHRSGLHIINRRCDGPILRVSNATQSTRLLVCTGSTSSCCPALRKKYHR